MKTKITHFVLMIAFILSVVDCSVDAVKLPPNCSLCVNSEFPIHYSRTATGLSELNRKIPKWY